MARIRNLEVRFKWQGFHSGEYARADIDFDAVEAGSVAGITAAVAAAVATQLPWGPVVAAVLVAHATQIVARRGPLGTTASIDTPVVNLPIPGGTSISYSGIGGEGSLLRANEQPAVFVVQGGQRRWIINPAVFEANGFSWSAIVSVSEAELNSIPRGPDLT